jgi:hypothetical protein
MPSVITLEKSLTAPIDLTSSYHCKTVLPHVNDDSIFVSVVHEILMHGPYPYGFNEIADYLSSLQQATTRNIKLVLSNVCEYKFDHEQVYQLDYFLVKTFIKIIEEGHPANASWNPLANKALFLMGKAEKIHRIGLLSKLYEHKLLDQLEWSFYTDKGINEQCKNILRHYSDYNFNKFLAKCVRDLDPIKKEMQYGTSHYGGFPYDVTLYENTCLSIISETECQHVAAEYEWITEKTWRAIANRHPFVMASSPATLAKLKSFGFKTFENYMIESEYDCIIDDWTRLQAIATNVEYFMATHHKHIDSIAADVEHNFQRFNQLAREEISKFQSFLNSDKIIYSEKDAMDMIGRFHYQPFGSLSLEMRKLLASQ